MTMLDDLTELHRKLREAHGGGAVEIHAHSMDALASELGQGSLELVEGPDYVTARLFGIPVVFDTRLARGAFEIRPVSRGYTFGRTP